MCPIHDPLDPEGAIRFSALGGDCTRKRCDITQRHEFDFRKAVVCLFSHSRKFAVSLAKSKISSCLPALCRPMPDDSTSGQAMREYSSAHRQPSRIHSKDTMAHLNGWVRIERTFPSADSWRRADAISKQTGSVGKRRMRCFESG
jgi:hypothetical protein